SAPGSSTRSWAGSSSPCRDSPPESEPLSTTEPSVPEEEDLSQTLFGVDLDPDAPAGKALFRGPQAVSGLPNLALVLVIRATGLYLLERLEPVLRPLLIAILLCYLFLPVYSRLRRYMRPIFTFLIIAVGITLGLQGLARLVYRDVVLIDANLPRYQQRMTQLEDHARAFSESILPKLKLSNPDELAPDSQDTLTRRLSQRVVQAATTAFLGVFLESIVVAFYMIFLLQSASRLPEKIRSSFPPVRAASILEVTRSINRAISDYLVVKVKASLLVAIPVALACWAFGITGAVTWGTITFFGNFLPYIGALVAIAPPVALAFLESTSLLAPAAFT